MIPRFRPARQWRLFWSLLGLGVVAGAVAWWSFMPRGFAVSHPRFWTNEVLPWIGVGVGVAMVFGTLRSTARWLVPPVLVVAAAVIGGSVAMRWLYPISAREIWLVGLSFGGLLAASAGYTVRGARPGAATVAGWTAAGIGLGAWMAWSQRGPEPTTDPMPIELVAPERAAPASHHRLAVAPGVVVLPDTERVRIEAGPLALQVYPLITFESRSPDRFWVLFTPLQILLAPGRRVEQVLDDGHSVWLRYSGPEPATIAVARRVAGEAITIDAVTELPAPVYSHLNTYAHVSVTGHRRLGIVFAPAPDTVIEVTPFDYPIGRPARFAFLGDDGMFRIVEATSGEKGPFHELGSGPLDPGEPLRFDLLDAGRPVVRIEIRDWATQASRARSPTAGWGVPVNAIEFSRSADAPDSPADVSFTLASTSVGRGFDSVGHAPGRYANRIVVERLVAY